MLLQQYKFLRKFVVIVFVILARISLFALRIVLLFHHRLFLIVVMVFVILARTGMFAQMIAVPHLHLRRLILIAMMVFVILARISLFVLKIVGLLLQFVLFKISVRMGMFTKEILIALKFSSRTVYMGVKIMPVSQKLAVFRICA